MKRRSSILLSILWNQIFWLLPLTIAFMSPILILGILGLYYFLTGGRPFQLLGASAGLFFLIWISLLLLRYFRLPRHFSGKERLKAQEIAAEFSEEMRHTDLTFRDWRKILRKALELNSKIARVYGIRGRRPEMNIRLCDVLLAIESISREMEQFLLTSGFSQIFEWGKLGQILYFVPTGKKGRSDSASGKEKKSSRNSSLDLLKNDDDRQNASGALGRWVYQPVFAYFFKRVGEYSIRINSGNLCYQSEATDSWKYPLKISISDWPETSRTEKTLSEKWLERLREENGDLYSMEEQRKSLQTDRLTLPEWGEILLTHERKIQQKELKIKELWKKFQAIFSATPIPNELLRGDLLLLFMKKNEVGELLSESSVKQKSLNDNFSQRLDRWKEKPIDERPFLVCVLSRESMEELCEAFSTSPEALRRKIHRALNLNENEAFVWFILENQSEISAAKSFDATRSSDTVKSFAPADRIDASDSFDETKTKTTSRPLSNVENSVSSNAEVGREIWEAWGKDSNETETEHKVGNVASENASPENGANETETENGDAKRLHAQQELLESLIQFAESVGEKIQTRKDASTSSEMKATARSERQNGFFSSRFVTPRWAFGLYCLAFMVCLVVNGVLFTQKTISRRSSSDCASSTFSDSASHAESVRENERRSNLEESETQIFLRKYGLNILACGIGVVCLLILFLFLKSRFRSQVLEVNPDEFWPSKERKAFEKVERLVDDLKLIEISGVQQIKDSLCKIVDLVDREYSGQTKARYSISLSEILRTQRILISRFRQTLAQELPTMDYLLLRDVWCGLVLYRYYLWGFNIYRKLLWINPTSATALELRRMVNQGIVKFFGKQIASCSILYALRLCGFYAVEVYSGNLFFKKDREPVRIFIIGGKETDLAACAEKLEGQTKESKLPLIQWRVAKNRINEEQTWLSFWTPPLRKCERELESSDVVLGIFQNQEEKDLLTRLETAFQKQERPPLFLLAEEKDVQNAAFHELQTLFAKEEREILRRKSKRFLAEYQAKNRR